MLGKIREDLGCGGAVERYSISGTGPNVYSI